MKKIYKLVLVIILFTPFLVKAQRTNYDFGIKLGANFSKMNGQYWNDGYKANYLGGLYFSINGGRVGAQLEGIFSQSTFETGKNFHDLYGGLYNNAKDSLIKGSFIVNYLSIPVLLNIKLFPRAIVQIGPQYSGLVSVKDKDALLKDAGNLFKGSFDGVIGIWMKLPAHLNLGIRYVIGLSDINDTNYNSSATQAKVNDAWKQRSLQLHLGYTIF